MWAMPRRFNAMPRRPAPLAGGAGQDGGFVQSRARSIMTGTGRQTVYATSFQIVRETGRCTV